MNTKTIIIFIYFKFYSRCTRFKERCNCIYTSYNCEIIIFFIIYYNISFICSINYSYSSTAAGKETTYSRS